MTTKDYCYDIHIKKNIDESKLKQKILSHLESLFNKYNKESEKLPIDIGISLLSTTHKQVCLDIKTRSKTVKKLIYSILKKISDKDLVIDENVFLSKPSDVCANFDFSKHAKGEKRWDTLIHNGPYFKHLDPSVKVVRLNANLIYDGKEYELNEKEEEVASFYAKRIITEEKSTKKYLDKKDFNSNFFKDFKTYLTSSHKKLFTDFKKFNFSLLVEKIKEIKEEKEEEKRLLREQKEQMKKQKIKPDDLKKKAERIEKLEKKLNYSFAFVNGIKKDIRNSAVELPGLYVGSGNVMTNKGKIKQVYNPEDVIINVSKNKIPLPPKGHKWGGVVHDQNAIWTAKYKDKTTDKYKYILLAETGDLLKFEKARKLNKYIKVVDKHIENLLKSSSKKDNQIGCSLYLIKEYGIRVGNECEEDEKCDTTEKVVGATTLMVQNVKCREENGKYFIDLSFKGKDSVSYDNTLTVKKNVYDHINSFLKKKSADHPLFDEITSNDVNKYLKSIDKDFSAKVFRTRLASSMMYKGLMELEYDEDVDDDQKIADFNEVNRLVAIKLNHKKGLTDAAKKSIQTQKDKISELKQKLKDEKDSKKKDKIKQDIKSKEAKLYEKDQSKEIALDTSKKNYIDPRIVKAWAEHVNLGGCKDEDEDEDEDDEEDDEDEKVIKHCVDKIYTKAHLKAFKWAIEDTAFDEEWDYEKTPLDCIVGDDLNSENKETKLKETKLKDIKISDPVFKKCLDDLKKKGFKETEIVQEFLKLRK